MVSRCLSFSEAGSRCAYSLDAFAELERALDRLRRPAPVHVLVFGGGERCRSSDAHST